MSESGDLAALLLLAGILASMAHGAVEVYRDSKAPVKKATAKKATAKKATAKKATAKK